MRVKKKIAIAAFYQAICSSKDRPYLVPEVMIAPIPRRDGLTREQYFCNPSIGGFCMTGVMSAQIENMSELRLRRQRTVGQARWPAVQRPPELPRGIEPCLEGRIKRQDEGVECENTAADISDEII